MPAPSRRALGALLAAAAVAAAAYGVRGKTARPLTTTGEDALEGAGGRCGVERWGVKTLSDPDASSVDLGGSQDATVAGLASSPAASPWAALVSAQQTVPDKRTTSGPYAETQVYRVHGLLLEARQEADHDYHLVLGDPQDPSKTMIVEIPDPSCPGATASTALTQITAARRTFDSLFNPAPAYPGDFKPPAPVPVTVSGVRFFDPIHGQTGVAPNGVELHPVLSLSRDGG